MKKSVLVLILVIAATVFARQSLSNPNNDVDDSEFQTCLVTQDSEADNCLPNPMDCSKGINEANQEECFK